MSDILPTIVAKSDQLNADDLMGGRTITITVTKVVVGGGEQPVAVSYQGDNGKPYMPGKSMRRVMVHIWGPETADYIGRQMTLYRDPTVRFGPMEVGGIRISHMSHMDRETVVPLTVKKGQKGGFKVRPLRAEPAPAAAAGASKADSVADRLVALFQACQDEEAVHSAVARAREPMDKLRALDDQGPYQRANAAQSVAYAAHIKPPADDEAPAEEETTP